MKDILKKIVADKRREVACRKRVIPASDLEHHTLFERKPISLVGTLVNGSGGIIAEHKRRSPSKAVINDQLNVQDVVSGYAKAGACGISVLTDGKYFGGSLDDLLLARASVATPLLRKEFIIDAYQLLEAKAYGADVILLIAAILTPLEVRTFTELSKSLGLEVLLEVHNVEELNEFLIPGIDMVGVNNRNLKTFEVDLQTSMALAPLIPEDFLKVSESGISSVDSIRELIGFGYKGFLIGENFMKTEDPGKVARIFIDDLKSRET